MYQLAETMCAADMSIKQPYFIPNHSKPFQTIPQSCTPMSRGSMNAILREQFRSDGEYAAALRVLKSFFNNTSGEGERVSSTLWLHGSGLGKSTLARLLGGDNVVHADFESPFGLMNCPDADTIVVCDSSCSSGHVNYHNKGALERVALNSATPNACCLSPVTCHLSPQQPPDVLPVIPPPRSFTVLQRMMRGEETAVAMRCRPCRRVRWAHKIIMITSRPPPADEARPDHWHELYFRHAPSTQQLREWCSTPDPVTDHSKAEAVAAVTRCRPPACVMSDSDM